MPAKDLRTTEVVVQAPTEPEEDAQNSSKVRRWSIKRYSTHSTKRDSAATATSSTSGSSLTSTEHDPLQHEGASHTVKQESVDANGDKRQHQRLSLGKRLSQWMKHGHQPEEEKGHESKSASSATNGEPKSIGSYTPTTLVCRNCYGPADCMSKETISVVCHRNCFECAYCAPNVKKTLNEDEFAVVNNTICCLYHVDAIRKDRRKSFSGYTAVLEEELKEERNYHESLTSAIAERDKELKLLQDQLHDATSKKRRKSWSHGDKYQSKLEAANEEIAKKDHQITTLEASFREKRQEIADMVDSLMKRLVFTSDSLKMRDLDMEQLRQRVVQQDQAIATSHDALLRARERVQELTQTLTDKETELLMTKEANKQHQRRSESIEQEKFRLRQDHNTGDESAVSPSHHHHDQVSRLEELLECREKELKRERKELVEVRQELYVLLKIMKANERTRITLDNSISKARHSV